MKDDDELAEEMEKAILHNLETYEAITDKFVEACNEGNEIDMEKYEKQRYSLELDINYQIEEIGAYDPEAAIKLNNKLNLI